MSDKEIIDTIIEEAILFYSTLEPLSLEFKKDIYQHSYLTTLEDGEVLLEQGGMCNAFYYVGNGALIAENRKDVKKITTWLCKAGGSCTSISGMYSNMPSEERIYALGKTHILTINNENILAWYDKFPEFNKIMRKMFEYYLQSAQERASMLRMGTAKQKYAYFKKAYPDYSEVITTDIIACFLGMKTSTLAFIIKEEEKQLSKESDINNNYHLLTEYLEKKRRYLLASLTLKQLASELQITPHILSEIINKKSGKNFNDFINSYRIVFVQHQLADVENWKHLKLEALGLEAGFKSRSSFFSVFKKQVGESPLIYLKNIKNTN